jgi:putative sigma-54 modulation protein
MKLKISFKHLDHTPALDQRIQEKSQKFEKFYKGNVDVQWICWVHEEKHWAEVKVHGPKFDFFAKAHADNMYKSLDLVVEKIERQFEKQKGQKKNRIQEASNQSLKYLEIQKQINEEEKVFFEELEEKSA